LKGATYWYIEEPKWLKDKQATMNIKNKDEKCFKYCLLYHFHKDEILHYAERITGMRN
jgi:hypothetical protein